jgi:selenocysteine lyase/cysteine desulfurase
MNIHDLFRPLINQYSGRKAKLKFLRKNTIGVRKKTYFDFTASGLAFKPIEKRINDVLLTYANIHSKESQLAHQTNNYYLESYQKLHSLLELEDRHLIIPTGFGSTGAIKKFQELMGIYLPPKTKQRLHLHHKNHHLPLVIVGPYEHHSNEISYREGLCQVKRVPLNHHGSFNLKKLEKILKQNQHRTLIGSFNVASNVTGIISPYKQISELLRKYHAIVCFDAVVSSPYFNIPANLYDVMFLSPHKLLGGPGSCGLLVIDQSIVDTNLPPTFAGGGTVEYVNRTIQLYKNDIFERETAGTPPILQFIKATLAYQLRNEIGFNLIHKIKKDNFKYFYHHLRKINGCHIYGHQISHSIGILSFNLKNIPPSTVCHLLSEKYGCETRSGCSCAGPYGHDLLGLPDLDAKPPNVGWVRASIHYMHTIRNIRQLLIAIESIM